MWQGKYSAAIYETSKNNFFNIKTDEKETIKVDLIDFSVHVWKTSKWHEARAKLFTELSNMSNLVNFREYSRHNVPKWS